MTIGIDEKIEVPQDEFDAAAKFAVTMRGRYILAQALYHGIKSLSSVTPDVDQEKSNIADMKMLQALFPEFPDITFDPEGLRSREKIEEIVGERGQDTNN